MAEILDALDRRLRAAVDGAAALLLATVTCLGIAQVFWRYVLNASLTWSEEAIRLMFVWLIFVGAANAPHLRVNLLADRLGPTGELILTLARRVVEIALLVVVVEGALRLNASFGDDSFVTLTITKRWYWSSAIVGGLLWAGLLVSGSVLLAVGRRGEE